MIEITKGERAAIRVRQREWKGRRMIDVRLFFRRPDGEMQPTGKGISVGIDEAGDLAAAIVAAARQEAPDEQ